MNVSRLKLLGQDLISFNPSYRFINNQREITVIALIALSCIAIAYLIYRSFFAAHPISNRFPVQNVPTPITHSTSNKTPTSKAGDSEQIGGNGVIERGIFLNGELNGLGKRIYPPIQGEDIQELEGNFIKGELNGTGKATYFDGRVFEGDFVDGNLVAGTKKYPFGKGYAIKLEQGAFKNDLLTGNAERHFFDGRIHQGHFLNGRLKIHVYVKTLTGKLIACDLFVDDPLETLSEMIKNLEGIPVDHQRMIFAGKQLESDKTFEDYRIMDQATLHLVLRLSGC